MEVIKVKYPDARVIRWVDDDTGEECGSCDYIRKDKYDELKKAADDMYKKLDDLTNKSLKKKSINYQEAKVIDNFLLAYRKATGDT